MGKVNVGPLVVPATSSHSHTLVMLHGRGSNAERFAFDISDLDKPGLLQARDSTGRTLQESFPGLKFIFPTAPLRRCSARKRMKMNIWFDSASFDDPSIREELHSEGISENAHVVSNILREEVKNIGLDKIFLGGISEGCAMALYVLVDMEIQTQSLAGFIGLSGWLPFQHHVEELLSGKYDAEFDDDDDPFSEKQNVPSEDESQVSNKNVLDAIRYMKEEVLEGEFKAQILASIQKTAMFLGHGEQDEVVQLELGQRVFDTFKSLGLHVQWRTYPDLGHWYKVPAEIDDIASFLSNQMSSK